MSVLTADSIFDMMPAMRERLAQDGKKTLARLILCDIYGYSWQEADEMVEAGIEIGYVPDEEDNSAPHL
jgi:hypothetical protein